MLPYRIALLFEYATLNGGERSMLAAIDWLQANDPRFAFVAIAPSIGRLADALHDRKIQVIDRPLKPSQGLPSLSGDVESQLMRLIESCQPDLLHANSLSMGRWTGRIASTLPIPTSSHLRDIIKLSRATINDLNQNTRLIAVSQATRRFHIAQGLCDDRCTVVHNGLDLNHFQPRARTGRLHAELGLPVTGAGSPNRRFPLIATIGQIGLRKGQDVLAAAATQIVAKVPHAHFLVIGERSSQKLESVQFEQTIVQTFAQSKLSDRLHLLGHREDVAAVLNEIDLLVHPANQEPFGRVLLEASACGVPIVATDVGGTSEIILDGETGLLVPPRDHHALAGSVIEVLTNFLRAERLRTQSRERALRQFSISDSARNLSQVWMEVLEHHHARPRLLDGRSLR